MHGTCRSVIIYKLFVIVLLLVILQNNGLRCLIYAAFCKPLVICLLGIQLKVIFCLHLRSCLGWLNFFLMNKRWSKWCTQNNATPSGRAVCRSAAFRLLRLCFHIPPGIIYVCLLWLLCVVTYRSLRGAHHHSTGVLPTVFLGCVWSRNVKNEEAIPVFGFIFFCFGVAIIWKKMYVKCCTSVTRHAVAQLVETLPYKPESRGLHSRVV